MIVPHNQRKRERCEDKGNEPRRSAEHVRGGGGPCVPSAIAHGANVEVQERGKCAFMSCTGLNCRRKPPPVFCSGPSADVPAIASGGFRVQPYIPTYTAEPLPRTSSLKSLNSALSIPCIFGNFPAGAHVWCNTTISIALSPAAACVSNPHLASPSAVVCASSKHGISLSHMVAKQSLFVVARTLKLLLRDSPTST